MASEKSIQQFLYQITRTSKGEKKSLPHLTRTKTTSLKQIMAQQNIVGVGIGEKVSQQKRTGKIGLTFYVKKKLPIEALSSEAKIPERIPNSAKKTIITDVIEIGVILPQINIAREPIQPGFSVGLLHEGVGTIGALVTDGKHKFILSNSHVLAKNGLAAKGDPVLYPSDEDGGVNPIDTVAHFHKAIQFKLNRGYVNKVDCAIALIQLDRNKTLRLGIKGIGIPTKTIQPKRDMKVVKVGRSTGKTSSVIRDAHFHIKIDYPGIGEVWFANQILCDQFTDSGDSGALVIDKKSGKAVGLHFAGGPEGSVCNPIGVVLQELGVTFLTKGMRVG